MNGKMSRGVPPKLRPGDTVVVDNLQAHLVAGIHEAIESRRATLRDLPNYSAKPRCATSPREHRSFAPLLGAHEFARYF